MKIINEFSNLDTSRNNVPDDLFASFLRSQINLLNKTLTHIEQGNKINGYVHDNIKSAEKDLRWLRKFYPFDH